MMPLVDALEIALQDKVVIVSPDDYDVITA